MLINFKYIHFVGIKGVGMAPLAIYAKEAGIEVSGSDIEDEFITDEVLREKGISWTVGFDPKELPAKTDLVIATGAHGGRDNPQVKEAKRRGLPVWMQGEAVGKFMEGLPARPAGGPAGRQGYFGISVTGSHGKTTTAAMLSTILAEAGLDPSYVVGCASMRPLGAAGHRGKGEYFVTEADEYANEPNELRKSTPVKQANSPRLWRGSVPKFLYQNPKIIVVTNIDFDHPDMFENIDEVGGAFLQFLQRLPRDGIAILNGDDPQIQKIIPLIVAKVITFGEAAKNDFYITKVGSIPQKTTFFAKYKDVELGEFLLSIPGRHNALNALSVIITGLEIGLPIEKIKSALPTFQGGRRRFEFVGKLAGGAVVYDDYAHHPKEIKETLLATKQWFPKHRIIVIFQPHTYSRTKALFNDFVNAFNGADETVITDIYPSLREEKDPAVSSQRLVDAMKRLGRRAVYIPIKENVVEYIEGKKLGEGDIVMTMGAGDIYKINEKLKMKN